MGYIIGSALGLTLLGVMVWIAHRLRMWQGGEQRDRLKSDSRVMDEAEILARGKSPFI